MNSTLLNGIKASSLVVIITDYIAIVGAYFLCYYMVNYYLSSQNHIVIVNQWVQPIIFAITTSIFILSVGLYNIKLRATFSGIVVRIFVCVLLAYVIDKLVYLLTRFNQPEHFAEYFAIITFCTLVVTRYLLSKTAYQRLGERNILVLGSGERAKVIEQYMRRKTDRIGLNFIGFIVMQGDSTDGIKNEQKLVLEEPLDVFAVKNRIDEIVVACDERRNVLPNESLAICKRQGINIKNIVDFFEHETGQVVVTQVYPSWIIYGPSHRYNQLHKTLDWLFNACIALAIFFITWPFMLIAMLAIKVEDGFSAPVLYSQTRVGLDGKPFSIYKFRSMSLDAEKDGAKWAQAADPRVTKVGNFLRKYRIDELPQLFNVLKGDMGFVGPRPERPQFTKQFEIDIPFYNQRYSVRPGLTGWAQLKYPYGSSEKDAIEKLKYDLYYIKYRGFLFDLLILLRTTEVVLFGKGR